MIYEISTVAWLSLRPDSLLSSGTHFVSGHSMLESVLGHYYNIIIWGINMLISKHLVYVILVDDLQRETA